jgi:hypothetical protein
MERRNDGTTETQTEGTRTRADTSGTGADTASRVKASRHLGEAFVSFALEKPRRTRTYAAAVALPFLSFHSPTAARPPVFCPTSIVLWDSVSANRLGNGSELKTKRKGNGARRNSTKGWHGTRESHHAANGVPSGCYFRMRSWCAGSTTRVPIGRCFRTSSLYSGASLVVPPDPSASVPEVSAPVRVPSFDFQSFRLSVVPTFSSSDFQKFRLPVVSTFRSFSRCPASFRPTSICEWDSVVCKPCGQRK